jgi:hypothetical protein
MSDKIKTYCEQQISKYYVNWHEKLDKLIKLKKNAKMADENRKYTDEYYQACHLSGCWVTCACGNQCSEIPRRGNGTPEDRHLASLGSTFYNHILNEHFESAKKTLAAIEIRSEELLREIAINKLKLNYHE